MEPTGQQTGFPAADKTIEPVAQDLLNLLSILPDLQLEMDPDM